MEKTASKPFKRDSPPIISPIAINEQKENKPTPSSYSVEEKPIKDSISSQRRIIENFTIIWLNSNLNESSEDFQNSIVRLQRIVNSVEIFYDSGDCVKFLKELKSEKAFMIVLSGFDKQMISLIQEMPQIESIYILSDQNSQHGLCTNECRQLKGVFNRIESICDVLRHDIRQTDNHFTPISILTPSPATDLNELNPSFMYSQLLKETLVEIKYDDNNFELCVIDEFEQNYDLHTPIWWYTRESFIYSMLNRALRTQEIDTIIKMGFFIPDLHRQIEQLHSKADKHSSMPVYRGQGMMNTEFEKMIKGKGGFLSFNNFLSTSTDRRVSLHFARQPQNNPGQMGIFFRMGIDLSISSSLFASLDNISYFADTEKEIFFSMHTVFRIGEMKQIETSLWQVDLILTSDKDEQLEYLTQYMREDSERRTGWHQLAYFMGKIAELDKAEECYEMLLQLTPNDDIEELAFLQHQLRCTNKHKGDLLSTLSYYEKTLEILQKLLPFNHPDVATTTINIGEIHRLMKNDATALLYFENMIENSTKVSFI